MPMCAGVHCRVERRALANRQLAGGGHSSALRDEKIAAQSTPEFTPSLSRYPAIFLQSAEVGIVKRDLKSAAYENRTKSAKCGGLEKTNGPRERISVLNGPLPWAKDYSKYRSSLLGGDFIKTGIFR